MLNFRGRVAIVTAARYAEQVGEGPPGNWHSHLGGLRKCHLSQIQTFGSAVRKCLLTATRSSPAAIASAGEMSAARRGSGGFS